ncbi:MAG: hypothetical protein ABSH52_04475 [Terriglobia bacterium]
MLNIVTHGRALRSLQLLLGMAMMAGSCATGTHIPSPAAGGIQIPAAGHPPHIVFACESDLGSLQALFADPTIIADLQDLHAGVALGLGDLSNGRAGVVRRLNAAGIPVDAWLDLPMEQGYYINASNEPQARARFAAFQKWTATNSLHWAAIGLDIEPNIQEFAALRNNKLPLFATLLGRYFDVGRVPRMREAYATLIRQMQSQGYLVETCQFPFIVDERDAHTTLLERLAGLVDVRGNREALMIYTSFNHAMDSAMVWAYGPRAQIIVVGITKSNPPTDARFPPLDWEEFSRDLRVAAHFSPTVGVFSLEGCVHQGFLPRLKSMNWNEPVTIPTGAVRKAKLLRSRIHIVLWIGSNLPYFLLAMVFGIGWWIWRRRRGRAAARGRG